jgi:hypothetical protein
MKTHQLLDVGKVCPICSYGLSETLFCNKCWFHIETSDCDIIFIQIILNKTNYYINFDYNTITAYHNQTVLLSNHIPDDLDYTNIKEYLLNKSEKLLVLV